MANDEGVSWPSIRTLCQRCRINERSAQIALEIARRIISPWGSYEECPHFLLGTRTTQNQFNKTIDARRLENAGRLFGKGVDRGVLCLAAQVP
jgi:hypothetical protein